MQKPNPHQQLTPTVVTPHAENSTIELETPKYRDTFVKFMLKGTQFYQTPSTGTIATVTSDMKWSSKLIDYLGNSLIDTHKTFYSFGLSMCLLRQIYDTSHTSTQSHLTDLRPITRLSPSIAKMHQTVIQHYGDFQTTNGSVKVYQPYHADLVLGHAFKRLILAIGLDQVTEFMRQAQCTQDELDSVTLFSQGNKEFTFFADPVGRKNLSDSLDDLLLQRFAKDNKHLIIPTAPTLRTMFAARRLTSLNDTEAANAVLQTDLGDQFYQGTNLIEDRKPQAATLLHVMLCQRENDPSTAHVLEHIDAALLNIDRRRLMKILCYAFGVLSQDITDIATSHFTNVLDFKPTRQGSAMQLVAEYNHETFHKHILAPTDIQIGYAFSPATYVQRHGFKITSKTTAATMKSKFIQFASQV